MSHVNKLRIEGMFLLFPKKKKKYYHSVIQKCCDMHGNKISSTKEATLLIRKEKISNYYLYTEKELQISMR